MATEEEVRQIKRRHSARLLQQPGVCGVAVEKGEHGDFVLAIHLDATQPDAGATIPDAIEGCRSGAFAAVHLSSSRIGVGTKESFAPPSEPNRQFSCIRLSSWWLLSRRSTNHGVSLF